jgi:hypothetical protein
MSATGTARPAPVCVAGFAASTGNHPPAYLCVSAVPVCSKGYVVHNDPTETAGTVSHNPRFAVMLPFNGRFVYECN